MGWARLSLSVCILTLGAACDQVTGRYEKSERPLITATCTLIEQRGVWHGYLGGDADYAILIRCPGDAQGDTTLLNATYDHFGLAKAGMEAGIQSITVFYCEQGGRQEVVDALEKQNRVSPLTGFRFALSPATANCRNHFPREEDRLTE